jgi:hypothetical protein
MTAKRSAVYISRLESFPFLKPRGAEGMQKHPHLIRQTSNVGLP